MSNALKKVPPYSSYNIKLSYTDNPESFNVKTLLIRTWSYLVSGSSNGLSLCVGVGVSVLVVVGGGVVVAVVVVVGSVVVVVLLVVVSGAAKDLTS